MYGTRLRTFYNLLSTISSLKVKININSNVNLSYDYISERMTVNTLSTQPEYTHKYKRERVGEELI